MPMNTVKGGKQRGPDKTIKTVTCKICGRTLTRRQARKSDDPIDSYDGIRVCRSHVTDRERAVNEARERAGLPAVLPAALSA